MFVENTTTKRTMGAKAAFSFAVCYFDSMPRRIFMMWSSDTFDTCRPEDELALTLALDDASLTEGWESDACT